MSPTTPSPYSSGTWLSAVRKDIAFCPLIDLCIISMNSLILFFSANCNAVFNLIYIDAEVVPNLAIECPFWPSLVLIWRIPIIILSTFSKRRYKQNIPGLSYYAFPALALKSAVSLRNSDAYCCKGVFPSKPFQQQPFQSWEIQKCKHIHTHSPLPAPLCPVTFPQAPSFPLLHGFCFLPVRILAAN